MICLNSRLVNIFNSLTQKRRISAAKLQNADYLTCQKGKVIQNLTLHLVFKRDSNGTQNDSDKRPLLNTLFFLLSCNPITRWGPNENPNYKKKD